MSKYARQPLDFEKLKTIGLQERGGKVKTSDFATAWSKSSGIRGWLDSLPHILAGDSFRAVVDSISAARARHRAVIWGLGGHVVKCGLAPVLIDLMRRGYATMFAMNGSAAIHDFEIALAGHTSEEVEAVLPDGRFGCAEETGREMNRAISAGDREALGMGESLGRWLELNSENRFAGCSLLLQAYAQNIPVTVHVAIGTDTPHTHPAADAAAIGSTSHRDFRLFCAYVAGLNDGGVYLNVGSAVVLPEVFLKAVSAVRNLGHPLAGFTTANFDFLQHYRPRVNVLERPHSRSLVTQLDRGAPPLKEAGGPEAPSRPAKGSAGAGYAITGHHELMVPLLAAALIEKDDD